ncbi:MAG: SDR family oxidoreductase [Hyphomicrobiaceae bacterium]
MTLSERTVFITGATSGIGLAIAEACLERGARVVLTGRRMDQVADLCARHGECAHGMALDVNDADAVASVPTSLPETFQDVDTLILSAGHDTGGRKRFDECDADEMASIIETNVNGLLRVTRAFIGAMRKRDGAHVIMIGSNAGLRVAPNFSTYTASKHAVHALSDSLRLDYAGEPIRITEICPGLVKTDFARTRLHGNTEGGEAYYEDAPQYLVPGDVAGAVIYALEAPAHVNISQIVIEPALTA